MLHGIVSGEPHPFYKWISQSSDSTSVGWNPSSFQVEGSNALNVWLFMALFTLHVDGSLTQTQWNPIWTQMDPNRIHMRPNWTPNGIRVYTSASQWNLNSQYAKMRSDLMRSKLVWTELVWSDLTWSPGLTNLVGPVRTVVWSNRM